MKEKDMEEAVVKAYMDLMVDGDEIFNSVLENFPDIEKGEIAIEYNVFDSFTAGISMIDEDEYDSTGKIVRKPTIYFGESFPNYPREKQEIIIAHEFGHYRKMKGMDDSELKFDLEMLTSSNIISHQIMPEIFRIEPSWKAEVKKWSLENEFYADKQAFKAGYGKVLLKFIRESPEYDLTPIGVEEKYARIKNLENLLRE